MAARDHHTALKSETVSKINEGYVEIALAKLQWGKDDIAYTLHVNPSAYTTAGLQTTDWLAYLGFERNDRCQFTGFNRCYSKEVAEGFNPQAFAVAFTGGFAQLQKAEKALQACGFSLPQPEGWGFHLGRASGRSSRSRLEMAGDGHTAMKTDSMKKSEDDKFLYRFTFIDTGSNKGFVTHYRPKHPPLSSELRSVFKHLGLREFKDCPEFDFEPCHFKTLQFFQDDDNPFHGKRRVRASGIRRARDAVLSRHRSAAGGKRGSRAGRHDISSVREARGAHARGHRGQCGAPDGSAEACA